MRMYIHRKLYDGSAATSVVTTILVVTAIFGVGMLSIRLWDLHTRDLLSASSAMASAVVCVVASVFGAVVFWLVRIAPARRTTKRAGLDKETGQ